MEIRQFETEIQSIADPRQRINRWIDFAEEHQQSCPADLLERLPGIRDDALRADYPLGAALVDRLLGWLKYDQADFTAALPLFVQARQAFRQVGDRNNEIRALNGIASCQCAISAYPLALDTYREALLLAEETGDQDQATLITGNIGITMIEIGDHANALGYLRKGLESGISPMNEAILRLSLGNALVSTGQLDEGEAELVLAENLARGHSFQPTLAEIQSNLGKLHCLRGDAEKSRACYAEALELARTCGQVLVEAAAFHGLGQLSEASGDAGEARRHYRDGLALITQSGNLLIELELTRSYASLLKKSGDFAQALEMRERQQALEQDQLQARMSRELAQMKSTQAQKEADLYRQLYDKITAIGEIGQLITANLDFDRIITLLYGQVTKVLSCDVFGLALYDQASGTLDFRLTVEQGAQVPPRVTTVGPDSFSGVCVLQGKDIMVNDVDREYSRYLANPPRSMGTGGPPVQSVIFIPLKVEEAVLGVIFVQSYQTNAYDLQDRQALRALGAYLAIALRNSRLFHHVSRMANEDVLTGAATRRQLFEAGEAELERQRSIGGPLSLVMMDLDHFKRLNDTHGHQAGDQVLSRLGALVLSMKRTTDLFARYGGEEFVLMLPDTPLEGAALLAQRICDTLAAGKTGLPAALSCTASFGVTELRASDTGLDQLIARADQALYLAKSGGRNRVASL